MATEFSAAYRQRIANLKKPLMFRGQRVVYLPLNRPATIDYVYTGGYAYNIRFLDFLDEQQVRFVYEKDIQPMEPAPMIQTPQPTNNQSLSMTDFYRAAGKALVKVARANRSFTTDEIWAEIPASARAGIEPRSMGGFMVEAQKQGSIEATDNYRKSKRPECHARPLRVWKSLL